MLKPVGPSGEVDEALECYAKHTAQIEVGTQNLLSQWNLTKQIIHLESFVFAKKMWPNIEDDCVSHCSDCATGPHHGGDSVPCAKHL